MKPDGARIERLEQAGVSPDRVLAAAHGRDEVQRAFDSYAAVARDYAGAA